MATKTWTGNAHQVRQISTVTVANTWAAADTGTLTINGKDLVVTIGTGGDATAAVATSIKEAWMSATGLAGTTNGTYATTSNFGGQEHGEFAEVTATVSGSVVTLTANTPGKPFTLAVTQATLGSGDLTLATPQAATGKHFWNNADNWDSGTVPADNDIVVFRDSDVSVKYGLPDSTDLEVTIQQWNSYTGEIGLPRINLDNPNLPYYEYRQRYVRLDDGGSGTNIAHRFGIGQDGLGSPLINLKHITVKCSPIVYNTGRPLDSRPGTKALNICCTANTSTLNILNGSVDYSSQDGSTSAFLTVTQANGDSRGIEAIHTTSAGISVSGGTALIGQAGAIAVVVCYGGTTRIENQTGTITAVNVQNDAVLQYASTATISALTMQGGTFDARVDAGGFTITSTDVYRGSRFLDPYGRLTVGTIFRLYYEPSNDLQLGAAPGASISITP